MKHRSLPFPKGAICGQRYYPKPAGPAKNRHPRTLAHNLIIFKTGASMNIAFIGLGNMGSAMATNLLKAGHTLTVYNRSRARADALKPLGARVAATPDEATAGAEVAITMLADDHALESVVFG